MSFKISIAEHAGFCFGVKRAIQLAFDTVKNHCPVVTLGPIIHNPQMVARLEEQGVRAVASIDEVDNATVIIRSHGITAQDYDRLKAEKLTIVDATCPFVKKAHEYGKKIIANNFRLVILGEKHHPEVEALVSYLNDTVVVVADPDEPLPFDRESKIGLIAQTTQSDAKFHRLAQRLLTMSKEVYMVNTICNATTLRQTATKKLAKNVDIMIVVGGKNSANTTRLAEIAKTEKCAVHHIETAHELNKAWFESVSHVGITAGASTPDWIIAEVEKNIKKLNK